MPENLLAVLEATNNRMKNEVDINTLKQILSRVMRNPLDVDRAKCQEQIECIIRQHLERR